MRSKSLFLKFVLLGIVLCVVPAIGLGQTTQTDGNVYLMSRLLNFSKGQAVGIHFCNVARETAAARIFFVDANGNIFKSASARVLPGQTVSISFHFRNFHGLAR